MDYFGLCSICLRNNISLISICQNDEENESLSFKLTECVPEIEWNEAVLICQECKNQVEVAFSFRTLCLHSYVLQKKIVVQDRNELLSVNSNSETKALKKTDENIANEGDSIKSKNIFICYHCNKEFRNKIILARHIKTQHAQPSIKTNENKAASIETKKVNINDLENKETDDINISTTEENQEEIHYSSENEIDDTNIPKSESKANESKKQPKTRITKFTCEDCPEIFNTSKKLIQHAIVTHKRSRQSIKPFQCIKCDNRFASSSNLVQHKKYHEGNRTNICTYCGKGFITTSDLINHEKQHLNKREYTCEFCSKGFNTHKDLRSHKIIKHKDPSTWNYHCTLCDKRFHIKPNYDNHMRRHMGDKRFTCKMCEKLFVTKDELRRHMISHTNVRDFHCNECGKEYKDKRVLDVHLVKIHNIGSAKIPVRVKKHLCNVCPKAFYDRNKLTRHMCTHSGERPFACSMCDKKFTDKSYVKHHLKVSHNVCVTNSF